VSCGEAIRYNDDSDALLSSLDDGQISSVRLTSPVAQYLYDCSPGKYIRIAVYPAGQEADIRDSRSSAFLLPEESTGLWKLLNAAVDELRPHTLSDLRNEYIHTPQAEPAQSLPVIPGAPAVRMVLAGGYAASGCGGWKRSGRRVQHCPAVRHQSGHPNQF